MDYRELFDEFGQWAEWDGQQRTRVFGVFESPFYQAQIGLGAESAALAFSAAVGDMPGVERGQAIAIGSEKFTISGVQPDGHGLVRLTLERA